MVSVDHNESVETTPSSTSTVYSLPYLTWLSLSFIFSRVLNEFILKNPNLESKKDQRELQVITVATLTPVQLSVVSTMFYN